MLRARLAAFALAAALPAAAHAEGVLDRLGEGENLRLGYRTDALPLSYVDDAGLAAGYTVDVCEAVAAELATTVGREAIDVEYVVVDTDDRFEAVAEGRVDLLCGADTVTLTRRETVDFSLPIFVDGTAVLLPADGTPTLDALAGGRVGVRADTTSEDALRTALEATGIEAEVVEFDTHQAGRDALMAGDLAAYLAEQSILIGLVLTSGAPDSLLISDDMLTIEKHALALPRGDDDFRLAIDRALSELYRRGEMARMFEAALPGVTPGLALQALFLLAPELP